MLMRQRHAYKKKHKKSMKEKEGTLSIGMPKSAIYITITRRSEGGGQLINLNSSELQLKKNNPYVSLHL